MKYLLCIFLLVAVVITEGCAGQKYKGTSNDNNYLDQFSRATFGECNSNIRDELNYNNMAGANAAARKCAEFIARSPYPDDGKLRQSRNLIISGYTQMARGDWVAGTDNLKAGNKIIDDYIALNRL
jgi:hypothetical protein